MKHLQLSPPLLIITMGYPGSGKSYFVRQFAELYGLARVSEDRIRYELFETPTFSDDEFDIIGRVEQYMLEQIMRTERTIICEGIFMKTVERKQLLELARSNGYRTLTVWLQTDVETSIQRSSTRDRRNPDSKYTFAVDTATFNRMKNNLQKPGEREPAVVVSGKHAFKSQCLTVLRKIAAMYSDSVSKGDFGVKPDSVKRPTSIRVRSTDQLIQ